MVSRMPCSKVWAGTQEFLLDFAGVNGVAAVVAGAVFDKSDQPAGMAAQVRGHRVHQVANQFHDADVGPFVVAANVVGFPVAPAGQHLPERLGVIAHIKPVAHVQAVAIDRNGLAVADRSR